MGRKVTNNKSKGPTKVLNLRNLALVDHWKLETWAENRKIGKYEAAEKILHDALKSVKLNLEETA